VTPSGKGPRTPVSPCAKWRPLRADVVRGHRAAGGRQATISPRHTWSEAHRVVRVRRTDTIPGLSHHAVRQKSSTCGRPMARWPWTTPGFDTPTPHHTVGRLLPQPPIFPTPMIRFTRYHLGAYHRTIRPTTTRNRLCDREVRVAMGEGRNLHPSLTPALALPLLPGIMPRVATSRRLPTSARPCSRCP